ncbi:MAG: tyrosine recombinase XerC [Burkholderiales bacterium]|nr:tyrosine recombinase XerC [Burkholderiales bacterium]
MNKLEAYLNRLTCEKRHAPNTLKAARQDLQLIDSNEIFSGAGESAALKIRHRLSQLHASGLSPATLARIASTWRGFFKFLLEQGEISEHPMVGIKTPKRPKHLPKALSPDQTSQLLDVSVPIDPSESDKIHIRVLSLALSELLYGGGLRLSEALGLDISQAAFEVRFSEAPCLGGWLNWSSGEIALVGKGGKPRIVPLTRVAAERLSDWLKIRSSMVPDLNETAVFIGAKGGRLSARAAQRLIAALANQSGLERHVHPHMLRHSFASHLLQSSGDLRAVQELLGHASIASTQVYTALDFQHLSTVYDKAHPRAKKRIT